MAFATRGTPRVRRRVVNIYTPGYPNQPPHQTQQPQTFHWQASHPDWPPTQPVHHPYRRDGLDTIGEQIAVVARYTWQTITMIWKNPARCLVATCLVWLVLPQTVNLLMWTFATPVCKLPLVSSHLSYCRASARPLSPDFREFARVQSRFQDAMEEATSSSIIAIDIKRSEMAVRDLTTLVKISSLVAKESLVQHLNQFVADAKSTGRNLQRFGGHVGTAVDHVVAMNEYALKMLKNVAKDAQPQVSDGRIQRVYHGLAPIKPIPPEVITARRKDIEATWYKATALMKSTVGGLILEAGANIEALEELENQLNVIHEIAAREDDKVSADKESLSGLWTKLGGNKRKLKQFESHTQLLKDVQKYRKTALDHVSSTLIQLQQLETDLEDLGERVTSPLLAGEVEGIPLEVHIGAMQKGTERLLEGRASSRERKDQYTQKMLNSQYY